MIVEIAFGLARGHVDGEKVRDGVFSGGLAGASGNTDDLAGPFRSRPSGGLLERFEGIGNHDLISGQAGRPTPLKHYGRSPLLKSGLHKIMAVKIRSA